MKHVKSKMRFLAIKLSALKSELKISREILQSASTEVDGMFNQKYFPEIPVKPEEKETDIKEFSERPQCEDDLKDPTHTEQEPSPPGADEEDKYTPPLKDIDPEVKKLFRKISFQVHPDKLEGLGEGFEKERKQKLYEIAREALTENDIIILSDIALELGLDVPEISEARLKKAENEIISIKEELNRIESTVVWHWFFTEDPTKKNEILEHLFKLMYEQKNNNPSP